MEGLLRGHARAAGELGGIAHAGGSEGREGGHHAGHGAGQADHGRADADHGEVGDAALEVSVDAGDLGEDGLLGHFLALGGHGEADADDVGEGRAAVLGVLVGGAVVALLEEVAQRLDVLGGIDLLGRGADVAVDDEPDEGHRADENRVHDPATFMEGVHHGLGVHAGSGGSGFLGLGEAGVDSTVIGRVTAPPAGASVPTVQTVSAIVHMDAAQGALLVASQSSGGGALGATMTAFEMAYVGS